MFIEGFGKIIFRNRGAIGEKDLICVSVQQANVHWNFDAFLCPVINELLQIDGINNHVFHFEVFGSSEDNGNNHLLLSEGGNGGWGKNAIVSCVVKPKILPISNIVVLLTVNIAEIVFNIIDAVDITYAAGVLVQNKNIIQKRIDVF